MAVTEKTALNPILETLAKKHVGDSKEPNLYFVSDPAEGCVAVFAEEDDAVEFAESIDDAYVEDRLQGLVFGEIDDDEEEDEGAEEETPEDA